MKRSPGAGLVDVVPGKKCQYDVVVKQADVKVTGTGKTFISAVVEDTTARIECIQWDPDEASVDAFTTHEVVVIHGKCGTYKDKPQITVDGVTVPKDIEWAHVLPTSLVNIGWMIDQLHSSIGVIRIIQPDLADLVLALTNTQDFLNLPAASFMHHAYVSGLLEHSLSVAHNAKRYSAIGEVRSGGWDLDVVLAGALLHDVGKVSEYTMTGKRIPASKELGHSLVGCNMVAQAAMTMNIDQDLLNKVMHVIASHHGRTDWGAVVEPQTPEAWLVHCMDLADSRMFSLSKRVKA